jgi:hypothetical protein
MCVVCDGVCTSGGEWCPGGAHEIIYYAGSVTIARPHSSYSNQQTLIRGYIAIAAAAAAACVLGPRFCSGHATSERASERGTNDWQLFDWSTPAALFVPRRRQRTNVFDDSRTGKLFQFAFPLLLVVVVFASACSHHSLSLSPFACVCTCHTQLNATS